METNIPQRVKFAIVIAIAAILFAVIAFAMTGAGVTTLIDFYLNSNLIGDSQGFNAIEGNNITITAVESGGKVDYTFSTSGAGPGTLQNLFETVTTPFGNSVIADDPNDILSFRSSDNTVTVSGDNTDDSIDFVVNQALLNFYSTVQDEGGNLTQRNNLNFTGTGVTCVDDGADSTDCDVPITKIPGIVVCSSTATIPVYCDFTSDGTNDQVEIQAAVDALPTTGGVIYLTGGNFVISGGISITKEGVVIQGEGFSSTRIQGNPAVDFFNITADRVILRDLRINGFGSPNPTAGVHVNGGRVYLLNVDIRSFNANPCIKITNSTLNYLNGVKILNCKIGIQLLNNSHGNIVNGGSINTNVADATLIDIQNSQQFKAYGLDLGGLQTSSTAISVDTINSEMGLYGVRFETFLNGIVWAQGDNDSIIGASFASTTNILTNRPTTSTVVTASAAENKIYFPFDCTSFANGGTLTVTGSGVVECQDDDLGSSGGYDTVEDEGSILTQRTTLNFTGAGVTCIDNAGGSRTDCDVPPDTNASTICVGTSTYLDGEGNCDILNSPTILFKTTDEVVNNSAVFQDDDEITFSGSGGEVYGWELTLIYKSGTTPDLKMRFNCLAANTDLLFRVSGNINRGLACEDGNFFNLPGVGITQADRVVVPFDGFVEFNSADILTLQWAQSVAEATDTTVSRGTFMKLWRVE